MTDTQKSRWLDAAAGDPAAVFEEGAAGLELVSYGDEPAEQKAALAGAVLMDIAGAGLVRTSGEAGLKLLRRLLASDIEKLAPGQAVRSVLLNASGGVMLEACAAALPGNAWELVLSPAGADAGLAWMRQVAIAFDADVQSLEAGHAFWLAGPEARAALEKTGAEPPREGSAKDVKREGGAFLSIAAFSGLYLVTGDADSANGFWLKLKAAGAVPVGERAFEALRASLCLPAPGAEYDESTSPLECGMGERVDFSDPSRMFIGRALTEARARSGARCELGLLEIACEAAAEDLVEAPDVSIEGNDAEGGLITSWVKTEGKVLALALLPATTLEGAKAVVSVKTEAGETVAVARVAKIAR